MRRISFVLVFSLVAGCSTCGAEKTASEGRGQTPPEPTPAEPKAELAPAPRPKPKVEEPRPRGDDVFKGAIAGTELAPFAPVKLGGTARSNVLEQAYAVGAAYALDGGAYVNLDIKNTFARSLGESMIEARLAEECLTTEMIAGHAACIRVEPERTAIHWHLPDRLTVDLAAPDEATARKCAAELRLKDLAALSSTK
jgi:hypothetical protein